MSLTKKKLSLVVSGDKKKRMLIYELVSALNSVCLIYCYFSLKSTVGCPPPINYTVPDINNNDVSYSASGLDPYTHYKVKVVAVNGNGEGHPVSTTVMTKEEGTILNFIIGATFPPLKIHFIYLL